MTEARSPTLTRMKLAWEGGEGAPRARQRSAQAGALGEDHGARPLEMLLVLEGGHGGDLRQPVDVVRRAHPIETSMASGLAIA